MNILEEVKMDMETILKKERTIKGYHIIKELLDVLPIEFIEDVRLEEDTLYLGMDKVGKLSNIEEIDTFINQLTEDVTYKQYKESYHICIRRKRGEDINIYFHNYCKNEETSNREYGYYEVTTSI